MGRPLSASLQRLLAGIHILDAVALVLEAAWNVKPLPSAILALILKRWWTGCGIAYIADAIVIKISLVRVCCEGTIIVGVKHAVVVVVVVADVTQPVTIIVGLVCISRERTIVAGIAHAITIRIKLIDIARGRTVVDAIQHSVIVLVG